MWLLQSLRETDKASRLLCCASEGTITVPIVANGRMGVPQIQTDGMMYESGSSAVNKQSFFQFRAQPGGIPESDISVRVTCKRLDSFCRQIAAADIKLKSIVVPPVRNALYFWRKVRALYIFPTIGATETLGL